MKSITNLAVILCVALATSSSAFAKARKPKTTLADFKGSYSGTALLTATGLSASGPLALTFAADKKGKTGSINLSGSISVGGGTTIPVSAVITLTNGAFSINNFVFNTVAQGSYPGFGSYTIGKKTISFQGSATVSPTTYPFSGTIVTKTKGRTQTITITEVLSSLPYSFTFTVSRHLKKSEVAK